MKTIEELFYRVTQPARFPRPMLKPNSQSGRQDQHDQEAKESSNQQSAQGSCGVTYSSSNIDFRKQGIPHSTVQKTGHKSQRNGQTIDSAIRESPEQGVFPARHETDRKDECIQQEVEEVDHRHGQHREIFATAFSTAPTRVLSFHGVVLKFLRCFFFHERRHLVEIDLQIVCRFLSQLVSLACLRI